MLSGLKNAELIPQYAEYIKDAEVRDALRMIVGLAAELEGWECYPQMKGEVRDFRFFDSEGEQVFSFITTQKWLLFYFRPPAVRSGKFDFQTLSSLIDTVSENNAGEWTVKIHNLSDLSTLWAYVFTNP